MNGYSKKVKDLFDKQSSEIIANSSVEHATVLYQEMFKHAQRQINILCKNISPEVFDSPDVLNAVDYLDKNKVCLNIAFQDETPKASKFLKKILESDNIKVSIFRVGQLLVEQRTSANFATMDDQAYRFEPDREYCRAIASANDKDFVSRLNNFFEKMTKVQA